MYPIHSRGKGGQGIVQVLQELAIEWSRLDRKEKQGLISRLRSGELLDQPGWRAADPGSASKAPQNIPHPLE